MPLSLRLCVAASLLHPTSLLTYILYLPMRTVVGLRYIQIQAGSATAGSNWLGPK